MRRSTLLVWAPRILGFLMVLFLSLFALDVFGEGLGFWRTLLALAMHLIPAGVAAAVLAIAWRWSAAGGAVFVLAGVAYAIMARGHPSWILTISGPLWLVGSLFILGSFSARQPKPVSSGAR